MLKRIEQAVVLGLAVVAIAAALYLLTACASPTPTAVPTPNLFNLTGTKWTLTAMAQNGADVPLVAQKPTLEFQAKQLGGNATCNSYSGDYTTQGEMIQVGPLQSTLMACADDKAMAQESAYLALLQNARMFELRETRLSITTANGTLVFERN